MILFASGRTDITSFYMKWFMNRLKEGYVDVRNPFFETYVSRIYFEDVDLIVFCTKNPTKLLDYINKINKKVMVHVTITPYKEDIEPNVINKSEVIKATLKLSEILGSEQVLVRYDPILINDKYSISYHLMAFDRLCILLKGKIKHFVISFIDLYKNVLNHLDDLKLHKISKDDIDIICTKFCEIASKYDMDIRSCGEDLDYSKYNFVNKGCVDRDFISSIVNKKLPKQNIRKGLSCNCVKMADIGVYNSCPHRCKYCYANFNEEKILENLKFRDDNSSLLIGKLKEGDIIKVRKE